LVANLTGAKNDAQQPIDQSAPIIGALGVSNTGNSAEQSLSATVHAGTFEFADDQRCLVYVADAAFVASSDYQGALNLLDSSAMQSVPAMLTGVAELGPVASRAFFVSAPGATPAGIYLVRY
jgi:hypothetical protein